MKGLCALLLFCVSVRLVHLQGPGSGTNGNLRLCVVEGRGPFKRGATFCPLLDDEKSGLECVLGTDQLDCLRRIGKNTVDFGVFSPEDLIAAQWADIDVLVTDELRNRFRPYARSIVAVVNRRILPDRPTSLDFVLRNTTLCHPVVGVNDLRPLSDTLTGYLESLIIPRACDPSLTLTENRIKALSEFFHKACKAGPWVPDVERDAELKGKYPNLCAGCANPACREDDKYWGPTGALECLLDNSGNTMWGELYEVQYIFRLNSSSVSGEPILSSKQFAYLCRDGTWQAIEDNLTPCVWLNRPWPVVIAKRKAAAAVSKLIGSLKEDDMFNSHWRGALTSLLEIRQPPTPLNPPKTPLDYLASAQGFREAYSQSGCDPPRHITLCTTTNLERNKCEWLSEAGAVYGINPPLQCVVRNTTRDCLKAVKAGDCDVAVGDSEWLIKSSRDYGLEPVLYETTPIVEKMDTVVAYVRNGDILTKMEHLSGKRAAFPFFDGMAWHTVLQYIKNKEKLNCAEAMFDYFSEICAPGIEDMDGDDISQMNIEKFTNGCIKNGDKVVSGEIAALQTLVEGKSDVAFISFKTANLYLNKQIMEPWADTDVDITPVCPDENKKYCYLAWSNIGHIFAARNLTDMRRQEIVNVFTKLDQRFGEHQPSHNVMFTIYGPFNHAMDVLFHNNTKTLSTADMYKNTHPYASMPLNFERTVTNDSCQITDLASDSVKSFAPTFLLLIPSLLLTILSR
ncbi:transferrin-like isoform X2 [Maniola hyperantus]|uniref:transferrin-like isoform X2 n=1 Tax=Aphantopus hyperantus TaxID=2795564 RepID=UPI0037487F1A